MKPIITNTSLLATALAVIGSLASAQAGSFSSDFNSGTPSGATLQDSAVVASDGGIDNSGCLKLIDEFTAGTGGAILDDLDGGTAIVSFTATFKALIGSVGNGADGVSFNLAPDLPLSGLNEEGGGTGLSVSFDTYANTVGEAPAVDVKVGGVQVASAFFPGLRPGRYVDVLVQLKPDNTLTVVYDGMYAYSNLNLTTFSYTPAAGSKFGLGSRCGGTTDNHFIDDLKIVTRTAAGAFVQSFAPQGRRVSPTSAIDILLNDLTTQVNSGSIVLKLDGVTVSPTIGGGSGQTSVHFAPASSFGYYTTHSVSLTFSDNATPTPQTTTLDYSFTVMPDYVAIFADGFESYTAGVSPLDMNYASGPNASANGNLAGNPWFGPAPPNARVLGSEGGVNPHSGNNMIRGSAASDFDENWLNLSYRLHKQIPFSGNIVLDWWFYDPLGPGGSSYKEYAAIGWYNLCPNDTDYPGTGSLNGSGQIQRLCLGADSNQAGSFDNTKYQTRVVSAQDGYNTGGWFNLPVSRSIGWHHARIAIEGKTTNSAPNVICYLDDMVQPCFVHNSILVYGGYNVIELNTAYGTTFGYMDDITFSVARPPKITTTAAGSMVTLTWPGDGFVLQSNPDVTDPLGWTDVAGAITGYTYDSNTGPQQFFRLRN